MLWVIGCVVTLATGGLIRILATNVRPDCYLHDTYFVVLHSQSMLALPILFGFFAACYHWFPKLTGYAYSDLLGRTHFWLLVVGVTIMVVPQILLLACMADVADLLGYGNRAARIGSYIAAASTLVFLANLVLSLLRRRPAD
jgi:cytochrome c oxidase subunit 1